MKSKTVPSSINPMILILSALALVMVFLTLSGTLLLSNLKINLLVLLALGMTICALGGIGRVAATNQWWHPLSILGYLVGGLILLLVLAVLAEWKLPLVTDGRQAFTVIAGLIAAKMLLSGAHVLLDRKRSRS